ncbi:MAG: hypothetical protein ABI972_10640 [Acidobacteriota bacterium]
MWMRMMLMALCAGAVWGQAIPSCPLSALDFYLGFDCASAQRRAIRNNNSDHEAWRQLKERRINQVKGEIDEETKRSPLDPTALGLRYAEVEAICREIDEREVRLVKVNRDVLNESQKTKLAVLEEALKLMPIAEEASGINLLVANSQPSTLTDRFSRLGILVPGTQRTGACAPAARAVNVNPFPF